MSRLELPDDLRAALQAAPYDRIKPMWAAIGSEFGRLGEAWLGRNDRFFLLSVLLHRADAWHPWLYERCREVEAAPDDHLDLWAREHYKMVRVDEPVATPSGWQAHGELRPGDWVFGPDGMPTRVVAISPVYTDGAAYELEFDDGTTMQAGAEHLWTVERHTRKRIKGTGKRQYRETLTLPTREIAAHDHAQDNRLAIPVNAPLDMPDAILPISPYTLGAWLGDGTSKDGRITCGDPEVFAAIAAEGCGVGRNATPLRSSEYRKINGLSGLLRGLGLYDNKHIPVFYQRASVRQRLELLRGLMDTDGHCNTRGTATFVNKNERLVDDVYELCIGLGLKPRKYAFEAAHGRYWHVAFQAYQAFNPFRLARKATRAKAGPRPHPRRYIVGCRPVDPVPMRCIQVERPDGLYLVGRQMVTTHNSTIITFAGIVQEIVRDPEVTIGIFSHTKPVARKFLMQVKQELESNADLKWVYPDVFYRDPRKDSPRWSEEKGLVVRRLSNPKEATLEAHGLVDGQPTGAHFRLRVYDDVVTRESVGTPEQVDKTTAAWELSDNLGARGPDGKARSWHIGTRYSFADTYQAILDRKALTPRIYAATDNGLPDGNPVLLPPEVWAEKKIKQGPATIACQMLQNPAAGNEAMFKPEWLRFIDIRPATLSVYIMVDPASSRKKGADSTAMAVVGIDAGGNRYLLDGYRHKMSLAERWQAMRGLRLVWQSMPGVQTVKVGYERYGMDSDLQYFEEKMRDERNAWEIVELAWPREGPGSKLDRIQRLQPYFAAGRFYLSAMSDGETANQRRVRAEGQPYRVFSPVKRRDHDGNLYSVNKALLDEYVVYPFSAHDDFLDAVSRIEDMDPVAPVIVDERALEPEVFEDGL